MGEGRKGSTHVLTERPWELTIYGVTSAIKLIEPTNTPLPYARVHEEKQLREPTSVDGPAAPPHPKLRPCHPRPRGRPRPRGATSNLK